MPKPFTLQNVTGTTVIPAGWNDILIIPSGSCTIYNTDIPANTLVISNPISFGTDRPNMNQWVSITIVGTAVVVINGEASV